MQSVIEPIEVNVSLANTAVAQANFDLALLLDTKAPFYFAKLLSGESGLIWKAKAAGPIFVNVRYVVSGNNTTLSVALTGAGTSESPHLITVNLATNGSGVATSTASTVKTAAEAVAEVAALVTIQLEGTTGNTALVALASTPLAYERYMEILSADDLLSLGFVNTDVVYKKAQAFFEQEDAPSKLAIFLLTAWSAIETEIAALRNAGKNSWYKVFGTTNSKSEIILNSNYLASIKKRYFGFTNDLTILVGRNQNRELLILHTDLSNHTDARLLGATVALEPGTFNYAYLRLSGATNSGFTNSQTSSILEDKGNVIALFSGFQVFWNGMTTGGAWADIIDLKDWLEARLLEDTSSVFLNNKKVGYTLKDLNKVESAMRRRLDSASEQEKIAPVESDDDRTRSDMGAYQYKIIIPDSISEIPDNDRNNRKFPVIKFSARLVGAINEMDIDGVVT